MNKLNGEETNKLAYTKSLLSTFLCKNINDYYRFNKTKVSLKNVSTGRDGERKDLYRKLLISQVQVASGIV